MNHFFKVKSLEEVMALRKQFSPVGHENISVSQSFSRILASDLCSPEDMPGFRRSTMDGYAVMADNTYGASEASPAWLKLTDTIVMGDLPDFTLKSGEAAEISTGGMLPEGADSVVMIEHTETIDETSVEIYKSVAPLQNVIDADEDFAKDDIVLNKGIRLRPQEVGLAAGLGFSKLDVFKTPKVGIISTGDEIIPIDEIPSPGKIRDINAYTLSGFIREAKACPVGFGIVKDDPAALKATIEKALEETDTVLISGGSSVGTRDFTVDVLSELDDTQILVHGISVSPGKPTILAKSSGKPVWGLPGQVVSAMVVLKVVVMPFLNRINGLGNEETPVKIPAILSRNLASAQGRLDFVRVRLDKSGKQVVAQPVLGKSGLIRTMIYAEGLLEIGDHVEGLEKGDPVDVMLL